MKETHQHPSRCLAWTVAGAVMLVSAGAGAQDGPPLSPSWLDAGDRTAGPSGDVSAGTADSSSNDEDGYSPLLGWKLAGMDLSFPLSIAERVETVSSFPIDRDGTRYTHDPALTTQLRAGAKFNSNLELRPVRLVAEFEIDALTGQHAGGVTDNVEGVHLPDSGETSTELRKASLQLDIGPYVHLKGGAMTSQWGMGLLGNDGAQVWEPGSAQFVDPRSGDRVLRGMVSAGPFTNQKVMAVFAADQVINDDILQDGDEAYQFVGSLIYGYDKPYGAGAYVVQRHQDTEDGKTIDVTAVDATIRWKGDVGAHEVSLEAEAVYIHGETTLGPTVDFPTQDVRQFGAAARAGLDMGQFGFVLDAIFASGDNNADDGAQTGLKVDPNYPMGLIVHRYVLGAQTARTPITASDPDLVAVPPEDLDRFPTQGQITNTIAFFPRVWGRPLNGLEIYGGPLLAFAERAPAEPFSSRLEGGEPTSALGGETGRYLGTELDVGVRYRRLMAGTELTLGLEGGYFAPGNAFENESGDGMGAVSAGRAMLQYRF